MVEPTGIEPVISYWQSSSTAPILLLLCQLKLILEHIMKGGTCSLGNQPTSPKPSDVKHSHHRENKRSPQSSIPLRRISVATRLMLIGARA